MSSENNFIDIPYEELKHTVLESLNNMGESYEFHNICNTVVRKVKKSNSFNISISPYDKEMIRQIIWDFIIERVLTIGDYNSDTWPWLSLTEYGKKVIQSSQPVPNDPAGYLDRIEREIPQLDPIIKKYLSESIRTYNINQLLSATITLGCASEKSLLILIDVFANSFIHDHKVEQFKNKINNKSIKIQFDEFDKSIRKILPAMPYDIRENYTNTLTGIFQMIRYNRNQAGHPTGTSIDKDTLFANLQVFIPYCKYIYSLIDYFSINKHE